MKERKFFGRKLLIIVFALAFAFTVYHFTFGNHGISGRVVDAETGEPIEGAIALCVWIEPRFLIETTHHVVSVSESISDNDGRIKAGGTWRMFLDPPELTIYKRGYRAWNNHERFPFAAIRTDFSWKNGFVAKMEKWKEGYSFNELHSFISHHQGGARFYKLLNEWEESEQQREPSRIFEDPSKKGVRK